MFGKVSLPVKVNQPNNAGSSKTKYKDPQSNQITSKETAFQGFKNLKQEAYNKVYSHELKHQQAGGSQAGSIVIDYDGNGVATSGHVSIQVPSAINKANPEQTKQKAETAYNAAMAPGDPSSADLSIASMAQSIMSKAMNMSSQKQMNPESDKNKKDGKELNILA